MDFEKECSRCENYDMPEQLQDAVILVSTSIEAIGLMVYRRIVPFQLVQELMGGTIGASWRVLKPHTDMLRRDLDRPSIHEWFQWLAERLADYPEYRDDEGAHVKYAEWRPERSALKNLEKQS